MQASRALLARSFGRLAADRIALIGGIVVLIALAFASAMVAVQVGSMGDDPSRQAASLRAGGWRGGTNMFDTTLSLLAVLLGITFLHRDMKDGTQLGIVARPVSRASVYLATWLAPAVFLLAFESVRSGILIGCAAWLEGRLDPAHVLGVVAVIVGEWLLLAGFAALGACLPPAYALLVGLLATTAVGYAFADSETITGTLRLVLVGVSAVLPLASQQTPAVVDALTGAAQNTVPLVEIILYRLSWTVLLLLAGILVYSRRDLTHEG